MSENTRAEQNFGALLTKVDVMPAQAPAASLPSTDSSPSFPLKSFCQFRN